MYMWCRHLKEKYSTENNSYVETTTRPGWVSWRTGKGLQDDNFSAIHVYALVINNILLYLTELRCTGSTMNSTIWDALWEHVPCDPYKLISTCASAQSDQWLRPSY